MTTNNTHKIKKPSSGQDVFIAQINTLAGVESQRYFVQQYWCDSGNQNQLLNLGILFTEKEDAIEKTKLLLGIKEEDKPIPVETVLDAIEKTKQPTKKYRYEKVGGEWSVWEYLKEYENSSDDDPWFYKLDSELEEYAPIFEWFNVAEILRANSNLYRRIEVTERELFIGRCEDIKKAVGDAPQVYFGMIYDELVNGKG